VLFHLNLEQISGGFVGVDVFFVISGFLISGIIIDELWADKFSITNFYVRRIRRILPASVFMLVITTLAVLILYLPYALDQFGKHLSYVALFSGNISFYQSVGDYWAPVSENNPLLHMWSLAVEEQFYFIFPIILFLVIRFLPKKLFLVILIIFIFSFGMNLLFTYSGDAEFAFFMLPTRAWELVVGALVFLLIRNPNFNISNQFRSILAYAGCILVLGSFFLIDQSMLFPGLPAVFPVLGTALIILAASPEHNLSGRVLAFAPIRFTGLISYSLYLWHWPIIVLYKEYAHHEELSGFEAGGLFIASFCAAIASWHFIEKPFRQNSIQKIVPFVCAIASIAFLYVSAGVLRATDGLPQRYQIISDKVARNILLSDIPDRNGSNRFQTFNAIETGGRLELFEQTTPRIAVIGDSHGAMMAPVLYDLAREFKVPISFITHDGKKPLLSHQVTADNLIYGHIKTWAPEVSILIYRWDKVWEENNPEEQKNIEDMLRRISRTSDQLVVVLQVPRILQSNERVAENIYRNYKKAGGKMPVIKDDEALALSLKTREFLKKLNLENLLIIDPSETLSRNGQIVYHDGGKLYYRDDDHLNRLGSTKLRNQFEPLFQTN